MAKIINENPERTKRQCFDILIKKLEQIQPGLSPNYQTEDVMRSRIIMAVQDIPECIAALYHPARTQETLCADLRQALTLAAISNPESSRSPT